MSTQVQRRRGTTAQHATFTGAVGELTVDTDKDVVVVHDGVTAGGHPSAKTSGAQTFTGDQTFDGNIVLAGADKGVVFEGTTADAFETTFKGGEPTADRVVTLPDATDTLVGKATVDTLTNKRVTPRVYAYAAPGATPTINTDNYDIVEMTAIAAAITSLTTNLSGTPTNDQFLQLNFTDDGTARALTFGASFAASTIALPTTTVISTKLSCLFQWNSATSKWVLVGKA
jgi:hypothetical protein